MTQRMILFRSANRQRVYPSEGLPNSADASFDVVEGVCNTRTVAEHRNRASSSV